MTGPGAFAALGAVLLAGVAAGEGLRLAGWAPEASRRVVHAWIGLAVALAPLWIAAPGPLYALATLFVAVNAVAVRRRWLAGMHGIRRVSWGTVTFPLALLVALALCWSLDPGRVYGLQAAFGVLALADPAASLIGTTLGEPGAYRVGGETKSLAGSAVFLAVAVAAGAAALAAFGPAGWNAGTVLGAALVTGALATGAEALGRRGWDNLWIVLAVVVPLAALGARPERLDQHLGALALAVAFGGLAFRARSLDLGGALAASLLAWMVVALGGIAWAAPAFTFFALSSALSRLGRRRKAGAEALAEKGSRRDVGQVLANGGVAGACLATSVFAPVDALYGAFVGAFAAAAADTWATEIGTLARSARLLLVGPRVPPGTSGGMSGAGTLGAVLGAASVVGAAALALGPAPGWRTLLGLLGAGVAGSLADSLLGATAQARYRAPDGSLTEHRQQDGRRLARAQGVRWLDNDGVNVLCTATGAALGALAVAVG